MNKKLEGRVTAKVKLGGVIATTDDEFYFLVMLRLKDLQWSYNSKCDAIFHIKMIVLQIFHYRHSRLNK